MLIKCHTGDSAEMRTYFGGPVLETQRVTTLKLYPEKIPYILESNPHPFYSFRGLKNQMRIRIACGLDSRSRAGFWKNDRAALSAVRTIQ